MLKSDHAKNMQLLAFDKEFNKKARNDDRLNEMWSVSSAMVHWLLEDELGPRFSQYL